MFDLTAPKGVEEYLEQTPFAATSVVTLAGGYVNFTYRITLREPYVDAGLDAPIKTLVMKHARSYLATYKDKTLAVERQVFECIALKLIPQLIAPSSTITLPTLYHADRENCAMIMSDIGLDSRTLHAVLQNGPLLDNVARDIGASLGTFIARLHISTLNPAPGTTAHTVKSAFTSNCHGNALMSSIFYSRIIPTLTTDQSPNSPPLKLCPETLAKLNVVMQKMPARINASADVLIMGDFRPGNILFVSDPAPYVAVVDWEVTHPGLPGMDLGQFLGELQVLRLSQPTSRGCIDIIIAAIMSAYRKTMLASGDHTDIERRLTGIAYDAATHIGAWMIMWVSHVAQLPREIVQEGIQYILRPADEDDTWLRGSIVGGLWG